MNKSLFSISAEMQNIINELMETGGELTPEIENALAITQDQLQTKSISYAVVIRAMEYQNATIDAEIKRLQDHKRTRSNTIERLKNSLSTAMQVFEMDVIEDATTKINFRKSQTLEIIDEAKVPKKYKTQVVTTKIDKNAIKNDIKNGDMVKGVELITNQNLQIK